MTFSSSLLFIFLYLPPRVHPQLHLSTTTKQVWACGPQETWPCSHALLVISFTTEFRQGPGPCALSGQCLDRSRNEAWLAMWMSTSGRVRDQPVSQYQTIASLFGICDGKIRCTAPLTLHKLTGQFTIENSNERDGIVGFPLDHSLTSCH